MNKRWYLSGLFMMLALFFAEFGQAQDVYNGLEWCLGYRSVDVYRGRYLGHNIVDSQFSAGLATSNHCDFNFGGYLAQGAQSDGFENVAGNAELVFSLPDNFKLAPMAQWNFYRHSEFKNGWDLGGRLEQEIVQDLTWEISSLYDTGQDGVYNEARVTYFPSLTDDVGLKIRVGVGGGYDYFETRGINEVYTRMSVPINVSFHWMIEPFVELSSQRGQSQGKERWCLGVWISYLY